MNEGRTAVTDRVYRSEEMRKAIESMATGVGREIGKSIEIAVIMLRCLYTPTWRSIASDPREGWGCAR